jgi:hypothetical protein
MAYRGKVAQACFVGRSLSYRELISKINSQNSKLGKKHTVKQALFNALSQYD